MSPYWKSPRKRRRRQPPGQGLLVAVRIARSTTAQVDSAQRIVPPHWIVAPDSPNRQVVSGGWPWSDKPVSLLFATKQPVSRSYRVTEMHENEIGTLIVDSAGIC